MEYPQSKLYTFAALHETVPVYTEPTVLSQDIVVAATKDFVGAIGTGRTLHIEGKLLYQACNDHECFSPVQQPVSWDVKVLPFDRVRSPEALQHKD